MGSTHLTCNKNGFNMFFSDLNIWILLKAFTTYVRPKLEYNTLKLQYNTSVWSPHLHKYIIAVESVQRRFTKLICKRCNVGYDTPHILTD